jgi:hypothetical protein
MKSVVRPELPTAAAGPSQAPAAAVDNSAPRSTHPEPTYKSGKTVQRTGTTSLFRQLRDGTKHFVAITDPRVDQCSISWRCA